MFIDIWDEDNKAIKINKFSKDLITLSKRYDAVNKLVADYGIILEGNRIKTDYYQIYFDSEEKYYNTYSMWFKDTLNFLTLFDCFTFLLSDSFKYLFDSEHINFIKITAGKKVMFKFDDRK